MKPRLLRSKSIPEQYIEDVFAELYSLDAIINDCSEYQRNYIITRLVTIIEQFFRNVVEDKLYSRQGKAPEPLNLDPGIIDEITSIHSKEDREITRELVISISYKFQSGDEIKNTMKKYGVKVFQDDVKKADYDELFELRHKIVHTFEQPPSKIKEYYKMTENLFKHVLSQIKIKHQSFYLLKIEALVDLGEYEKAVECFKEAKLYYDGLLNQSPKSTLVYYDRALALQRLGEYEKAIADFDQMISYAQKDSMSYKYMGMRLRKSKEIDGVRLQELAEYNKGIALQEINKHDAAVECFNKVLKINPRSIDAYISKSKSLQNLGKTMEAQECLKNSVWLSDPIDGSDYHKIAKLLLDLGSLDESAKCFAKALTLFNEGMDAGDAFASYRKGMLLQDLYRNE